MASSISSVRSSRLMGRCAEFVLFAQEQERPLSLHSRLETRGPFLITSVQYVRGGGTHAAWSHNHETFGWSKCHKGANIKTVNNHLTLICGSKATRIAQIILLDWSTVEPHSTTSTCACTLIIARIPALRLVGSTV